RRVEGNERNARTQCLSEIPGTESRRDSATKPRVARNERATESWRDRIITGDNHPVFMILSCHDSVCLSGLAKSSRLESNLDDCSAVQRGKWGHVLTFNFSIAPKSSRIAHAASGPA